MGEDIARRLAAMAELMPEAIAIVVPRSHSSGIKRQYDTCTFRQLEDECNRLASGLRAFGVGVNARMVVRLRPGIEFVAVVFALFKIGAIVVLVDPGMGRRRLLTCLADLDPDGFVPSVPAS
jgi:acyl-CoA synthetase (AMP-forming)/AMP-acid ligase II